MTSPSSTESPGMFATNQCQNSARVLNRKTADECAQKEHAPKETEAGVLDELDSAKPALLKLPPQLFSSLDK
jgi:hypothetical protein